MISVDCRVGSVCRGGVGKSAVNEGAMVKMMKVSMARVTVKRSSGDETDRRKGCDDLSNAHCKECGEVCCCERE
jgi:hypothetical protein